ncbi:MAG: sodium:alanine symporter family protein [Burkholderiaceae bacterium]|nr:sodium:alanine symporter family protein [Burkholderiaceae bacterium]
MKSVTEWFEMLGSWVWGPVMLVMLVGTGLYLTIRMGGMQFLLLPKALKLAFSGQTNIGEPGEISPFQALMTAMAATIGTGNIAGVATAVVMGGPGAIFWMWLTAMLGMATKYAEAYLAVYFRVIDDQGRVSGGPMYYIERGLNMKWLAIIFAICGTVAAFGAGCSVQSNSVAQVVERNFGLMPWVTGILLSSLTGLVLIGGLKRIAHVISFIVPVMAIFYVGGGLLIIVNQYELVFPALTLIVQDAFTGEAVAGGAIGAVIRYGISRGIFSNEAGLGTAPMAAASARTTKPAEQGLISMTGTFLDTIIVCSITGIVLVMAGQYETGLTGAALTALSFDLLLPGFGTWVITIGLIFFAYSTILGWSFYGEKCAQYLMGECAIKPYRVLYTAMVFVGTMITLDLVWAISDLFNGLMAFPNLIGLLLLSGLVIKNNPLKNKPFKTQS